MNDFDIPIFNKSYTIYKNFCEFRVSVPKQDRYTVWIRCENYMLDVIEGLLQASQTKGLSKVQVLERVSLKLNLLRVFIRLAKDTRAIDTKRYIVFEEGVDEIGRMLGGWLRSSKNI